MPKLKTNRQRGRFPDTKNGYKEAMAFKGKWEREGYKTRQKKEDGVIRIYTDEPSDRTLKKRLKEMKKTQKKKRNK
jgi:hypothetical protein